MGPWILILALGLFCAWTLLRLLGAERERRIEAMQAQWHEEMHALAKRLKEARVPHGLNPVRKH